MKYTIEKLPESQVAVDVELEAELVEKALDRAAQRISRRGRIPGFRPGKAPRRVVESRYGRGALYEEAADDLIREAYKEILQKDEFTPIAQASVESMNLEPFSFRLVIPVRPTVTLGDYRALRFPEEVRTISDEDVQRALEHLQAEQTIWKEPDPARPSRLGDRLLVDLVGKVGEREIENRQQVELVLGDAGLLPGFSDPLVGAEPGQTVEVHTTLPTELDDKELAGQEVTYTVTVHAIKEPEVPALDDDFARSLNQDETLADLRDRLRRGMEEAAGKQAREQVLERMLEAVIDGATVDMPQVLVEEEAEALYKEQAEQVGNLHIPMARYLQVLGKTEEELRQELREAAPARLRRFLVLQEFMRAEGLAGQKGDELRDSLESRLLAIARGEAPPVEAETAAEAQGTAGADVAETVPAGEAAAPVAMLPAQAEPAAAVSELAAGQDGPSAAGEEPAEKGAGGGTAEE